MLMNHATFMVFKIANMFLNAIRENTTLAKISEFTVNNTFENDLMIIM